MRTSLRPRLGFGECPDSEADHPERQGPRCPIMRPPFVIAVAGLVIGILATACCLRPDPPPPLPPPNVVKDPIIQDLEARSGMSLPIAAAVLDSYQGVRDPDYDFYAWTIFSTPITLPTMNPIRTYERLWLSTVKVLEVSIQPRKMSAPTAIFRDKWQFNTHEFRGNLVRTSEGDYLYVEQFRKEPSCAARCKGKLEFASLGLSQSVYSLVLV